jgi:hypothetical protein
MNNHKTAIETVKRISLHVSNPDNWSETPLLYRNYLKENGTWQ